MSMQAESTIVCSLTTSPLLDLVARRLNARKAVASIGTFPDSELFLKSFSSYEMQGTHIVVVADFLDSSLCKSEKLMALFALLDFLNAHQVKSICLLAPYLAYSRQVLSLQGSQPGFLNSIARMLKFFNVEQIVTADLHDQIAINYFGDALFSIEMAQFWAAQVLPLVDSRHDTMIVSPDQGGLKRAANMASFLGLDVGFVHKKRTENDVVVTHVCAEVTNKRVILYDDILDTGTTARKATDSLLTTGASEVIGCFSHPVLSPGARKTMAHSPLSKVMYAQPFACGKALHEKERMVSCTEYIATAFTQYYLEQQYADTRIKTGRLNT